jgi:hypothetical protein
MNLKKMAFPAAVGVSTVAWAAISLSVVAGLRDSNLNVELSGTGFQANQSVDLRATADARVTYACVNRGGQVPNSPNMTRTVDQTVHRNVTLTANNQGELNGSLLLNPPPAGNFSCPRGLERRVAHVRFSNLSVTGLNGQINEQISGTWQREFIKLSK